jgi:DNA-binding IclR family transcriptional regulator
MSHASPASLPLTPVVSNSSVETTEETTETVTNEQVASGTSRQQRLPSDRVQSLRRAFMILETLASHGAAGLPLKKLSQTVGLHPSTVHHLLSSLRFHGYVEQDPDTGNYRLGAAVLTLANRYLQTCDLARLAEPLLRRLHRQFDELVVLAVPAGSRYHVVYQLQSAHPLVLNPRQSTGDFHCSAVGKVLLSGLDPVELDTLLASRSWPRYTPYTITDLDQLRREIAQVREQGYAVSREEHYEGLIGVAAPVYGATGHLVASVGLAFPTLRADPLREQAILLAVRRTAAELSLRLGYHPATAFLQDLKERNVGTRG